MQESTAKMLRNSYLAVDDKVEGGIHDNKQVVNGDSDSGPSREFGTLTVDDVDQLVERDKDLTNHNLYHPSLLLKARPFHKHEK